MVAQNHEGIRPDREICNVSRNLVAKIEDLRIKMQDFSGASLDRRKFFDLLERDICDNLLRDLGALAETINAEDRLYRDFKYRSKVGDAISHGYQRKRGFVQGCSWSLDAALAIMTIWTKAAEAESQVEVSSFADDSSFLSTGDNHTDKTVSAWKVSLEFDKLARTELIIKKTNFY